jgi:hypothetical protein
VRFDAIGVIDTSNCTSTITTVTVSVISSIIVAVS